MNRVLTGFSPAMLLAAGGLASPAAATTVVQNYGYNALASDDAFYDVTIGASATPQFAFYNSSGAPKLEGSGTSGIGPSYPTFTTPDGTEDYSSFKYTFAADETSYVLLKFDIGNKTTYGTAFVSNATLNSITYESVVPEPAVWAELIAGFGLAGSAVRVSRRRRQPVAAR